LHIYVIFVPQQQEMSDVVFTVTDAVKNYRENGDDLSIASSALQQLYGWVHHKLRKNRPISEAVEVALYSFQCAQQ
jgi:hypothetical protein